MDLYFRESGKYDLDQIPENIWNRVIEELFSCKYITANLENAKTR
jgi:hypothetical protein